MENGINVAVCKVDVVAVNATVILFRLFSYTSLCVRLFGFRQI